MAIKRVKQRPIVDATDAADNRLETLRSLEGNKEKLEEIDKSNGNEKREKHLDLLAIMKPSNCVQKTRTNQKGGFSVIYAETGKRVTLSKTMLNLLSSDLDSIQIGYTDTALIIGEYLGKEYTNYTLKTLGKSLAIYNSELVKEIKDIYNLDFTNKSSLTFGVKKLEDLEDKKIIFIDMLKNN